VIINQIRHGKFYSKIEYLKIANGKNVLKGLNLKMFLSIPTHKEVNVTSLERVL